MSKKSSSRRHAKPRPAPAKRKGARDAQAARRPATAAMPTREDLRRRIRDLGLRPTVDLGRIEASLRRIPPHAPDPVEQLPEERRESLQALRPREKRFHGAKISLRWFPWHLVGSPCADKFGYLSSAAVRTATRLPFNPVSQIALNQLGDLMGDPGREQSIPDTSLPAGFTYVGQFVDHDITLDVSSSLDALTDANTIHNMRSPRLDLDSVYGRGPALQPYLYAFPAPGGNPTAIKLQLGTNMPSGPGGPGGSSGPGGMVPQVDFDVPRSQGANTALIGDPRNDENLIVSQFHQTMLRFHNQVVDLLLLAGFTGDVFAESKRIVTQHYQWAVVHDFLGRICGASAVSAALSGVVAPVNSPFRMPVEFAVAAYRFGHTMIREQYWLSAAQPGASLADVFNFIRSPNLPVLSNWVVDFNAFFDTGVPVAVNNKARAIDSVLTPGLEALPGFSGLMAVLAKRNLRRGLALGLPSGQGMAGAFGITPLTPAELVQGLPPSEAALLHGNGGLLLQRTPLWYYVLREAAVLHAGQQLGPVGAKIVADTFVRMLKRDGDSYLNVPGGFTPFLPAVAPGDFTFADLVIFAGVTQP